ncbi:MAG: hypothetical protein K0V04_36975 [Deltaproteobacteria bacterium]|nr:hypothetical protein [Deltaproteobacteria bacterium]
MGTPDNALARVTPFPKNVGITPKPSFEIVERGSSDFRLRVEFDEDTLTTGANPVMRVTAGGNTTVGGKPAKISCGSTEGTPDDASMTITTIDGKRLTGTIDLVLTRCNDWATAKPVALERLKVSGTFSNVPFQVAD